MSRYSHLFSFLLPPKSGKLTMKEHPKISPPSFSTKAMPASAVPPVASRSSTIRTLSPADYASSCISKVAFPYSNS